MKRCSRRIEVATALVAMLSLVGCGGGGAVDDDAKSKDVAPKIPEITVAVPAGGEQGAISGPLYHWREQWEKEAGAKLNIVEIPEERIHERVMADASSSGGEFDGVVIPAWMYGDLIARDYPLAITEFREKPKFPKWREESVVPPIAKLLTWNNVWYGCPNDGAAYLFYYRKDILGDEQFQDDFEAKTGNRMYVPPRTWEEVADIAEFSRGLDWNGNGVDDEQGIALHLKPGDRAYRQFLSIAAPYVVNVGRRVTRHENVYAFDPETMAPIIDSPGHIRGFEMLRRLAATGKEAPLDQGRAEAQERFLSGAALFCVSGGELGRLAQDPKASKVQGKLGCDVLPGTMELWNLRKGEWSTLARPNVVHNTLGPAWHGIIRKNSKRADLVYHLFAFQASRPVSMFNVTRNSSGIDPSRTFQFLHPRGDARPKEYVSQGFDEKDMIEYTQAFWENYENTGATLDSLRIPGADRFHAALDEGLAQALAHPSIPAEQAMKDIAEKWRAIVAELEGEIGADRLKVLYRQSIGYRPKEE